MSCILTNIKTNKSFVAIDELLSLKFEHGFVIINGIIELKPEEILEIKYKKETKK